MKSMKQFVLILFSLACFLAAASAPAADCPTEGESGKCETGLIDTMWSWAQEKSRQAVETAERLRDRILGYWEETQKERRVKQKLADMPDYQAAERKKQKENLEELKRRVSLQTLYRIQREDVEREPLLESADWQPSGVAVLRNEVRAVQPLRSPDAYGDERLRTMLEKSGPYQVQSVTPDSLVAPMEMKPVTVDKLAQWTWPLKDEAPLDLKEFVEYGPQELSLVSAGILVRKKQCALALGLIYDAEKARATDVRREAHGLHVECLLQMGLYSQVLALIETLLNRDPEVFGSARIAHLQKNLPEVFRHALGQVYGRIKNWPLRETKLAPIRYAMAISAIYHGQRQRAWELFSEIPAAAEEYAGAQYALAVMEFEKGRYRDSIRRLTSILKHPGRADESLRELAKLSIARSLFQMKAYKKSIEYYHQIDKKSPFWITALTELGWAQLGDGDFAGAIGNMFSLHNPYFSAVYQPETYVIRTIGYLSICQYPDAYKSLTYLQNTYASWKDQLTAFLRTQPKPEALQALYTDFLNAQKSEKIPNQIFREAGRKKAVTNRQKELNYLLKESAEHSRIESGIALKIANLERRASALNVKLEERTRLKAPAKELAPIRQEIEWLGSFASMLREARAAFSKTAKEERRRLAARQGELRSEIGRELLAELKGVEGELARILDHNGFLRFEIFSGSGENLRMLGDGQAMQQRKIASTVQPQSKSLKWVFDGEIWLDEIGHYKSSLNNNCADGRKTAQVR